MFNRMPNRELLGGALTVINFTGASAPGGREYQHTFIKYAAVSQRRGEDTLSHGVKTDDKLTFELYEGLYEAASSLGERRTYAAPEEFIKMPDKSGHFTLNQGHDLIREGHSNAPAGEYPGKEYLLRSVYAARGAAGTLHHFECAGA